MNDYQLWFASAILPYKVKNQLINIYGSAENIWYAFINEDIKFNNSSLIIEKLKSAWNVKKFDNIKYFIDKENIKTLIVSDSKYPNKLKIYNDCPYMLFYKGNINYLKMKSVAIIGSRKCTHYGENITRILAKSLSNNNILVVSGMARGIDSCAHKEILNSHGKTCAILGSGINVVYPKENQELYNNIISEGCVISQFIPGTPPYSYNFPIRNKIISALSDLVIVVEASNKSGSLITAGSALDQGKDVIAVPGNIFSNQSKGCNKLIKDGAFVFTSLEDIYELLSIDIFQKDDIKNMNLDEEEKKVYSSILNKPIHVDDLLKKVNFNISKLYEILFDLELKKRIKHLAGDFYIRNYNCIK
ncbi:DNA-processing protein DprA [Clostridium sediminicola]|uniref:DNA-processing protein DprA n=1 Tax=Clostridium sediminicola TaxID=3114879 RepID=UPI0031F21EE3